MLSLQTLQSLLRLSLENCGISDGGVASIVAVIDKVPRLQALVLRRNHLGKASSRALGWMVAGESVDSAEMVRKSNSKAAQDKDVAKLMNSSAVLKDIRAKSAEAKGPRARAAMEAAAAAEMERLQAMAAKPKIKARPVVGVSIFLYLVCGNESGSVRAVFCRCL